jgi:hypothetical protein
MEDPIGEPFAVSALVKIGKPASLECLKRLALKDNDKELPALIRKDSLLRIIQQVEGDDVTRFMLQNAIDKEQDKDKKANLTAALELLDKWIKADAERNKPPENPPVPPADGGTPPASGEAANIRPNVKDLYGQDSKTPRHVYGVLVDQRNEDITNLIAIVRDKNADPDFDGPKNCAVELLGECRAIEAIDALMETLFYAPRPHVIDYSHCQEEYYTCAVALEKIGSPCLDKIYARMPKAERKEQQLLAWIVEGILQKGEAIAALEFQKQKASKDDKHAFDEAIEYLKNYKPVFEPPPEAGGPFHFEMQPAPPVDGTTPPANDGTVPPADGATPPASDTGGNP